MNVFCKSFLLATTLVCVMACDNSEDPVIDASVEEVIVANEGNFGSANGGISGYIPETEQTNLQVYSPQALVQYIMMHNNLLYLVCQGPDKLDVVSAEDYNAVTSASEGMLNPVSFAISGTLGFVANWGSIATAFTDNPESFITVYNLSDLSVVDTIHVTARPQSLLSLEGNIYVAFEGGDFIGKINPATLQMQTLQVPAGPSAMVADQRNNLWVSSTAGSLTEIITADFTEGRSMDNLPMTVFAQKLAIDQSADIIYFFGTDAAYSVDISSSALSAIVFTDEDIDYYAINVNPENGEVYIGNSNAFATTGTGLRFGRDGTLIDDFATGIGPSGFLFK